LAASGLKISLLGDIVIPQKQVRIECALNTPVIANWEAPLVGQSNLALRPKAGSYLKSYGIPDLFKESIFCLANNHIMDFGDMGLQQTLLDCRKRQIATVGAGKNLQEARTPVILEKEGIRIGVLARCESQFGIATTTRSGVAPLDATIYASIRDLKSQVDIVIVSVHGAAEMCPWPSPPWQDLLRSFIDAGATIVHGHHAHIPQGFEEYKSGLIFYGLGNFCVDPACWRNCKDALWSLVIDLQVSREGIEQYAVRTVGMEEEDGAIFIRDSIFQEENYRREYLEEINNPLRNRILLLGLWQEFSIREYYKTYARWLGFESGYFLYKLKRIFKKVIKVSLNDRLLRYHLFSCESHREAITTALGVLSGELEDLRTKESRILSDQFMPWTKSVKV